jgi:hypothetical protein
MTIFSSEYCTNISQHTTKSIRNGTDTSSQTVADYKTAADTGFKGKPCQMGVDTSTLQVVLGTHTSIFCIADNRSIQQSNQPQTTLNTFSSIIA